MSAPNPRYQSRLTPEAQSLVDTYFARVVEELVSGSTLTNRRVPVGSQGGSAAPVVANAG